MFYIQENEILLTLKDERLFLACIKTNKIINYFAYFKSTFIKELIYAGEISNKLIYNNINFDTGKTNLILINLILK